MRHLLAENGPRFTLSVAKGSVTSTVYCNLVYDLAALRTNFYVFFPDRSIEMNLMLVLLISPDSELQTPNLT